MGYTFIYRAGVPIEEIKRPARMQGPVNIDRSLRLMVLQVAVDRTLNHKELLYGL
jgi:hypothetical protein